MVALADPLSQLVAVFIVPLFSRRVLMILGGILIGGLNAMLAFFDMTNDNLAVFIVVIALVFVTSIA